ncbi:MAG: nitrate ABC transporter substrate-binding protein [Firmicutes bacterium HGW-Firmicutes-15]|nr:MAG: nitrate ABC transporter substrate-binding protein [Firmicutes bacterium HGW-Firmicutes-15]
MMEAQTRMETDTLIALMILAALIGYTLDRLLLLFNKTLTAWRYVQ